MNLKLEDTDGKRGSGNLDLFENRIARAAPESAWEFFVRVCMDEVAVYSSPQTLLSDSEVLVRADPATSTITVRVPVSVVGDPDEDWSAIIAVVSHEGLFSAGKVRAILPQATEWEFGGGDGDADADAALDGLAESLVPGGAEGLVGEEGVEELLAVADGVAGGGPRDDVGGEVALKVLAAAEGDFDRVGVGAVIAGVDVDF